PSDLWLEDRLARVIARRVRAAPKEKIPAIEGASEGEEGSRRAFARAAAYIDAGDLAQATALIDAILAREPAALHALRALEAIARKTGSTPLLANVLEQQASAFQADAPRLGALWAEAELVEWKLPASG